MIPSKGFFRLWGRAWFPTSKMVNAPGEPLGNSPETLSKQTCLVEKYAAGYRACAWSHPSKHAGPVRCISRS